MSAEPEGRFALLHLSDLHFGRNSRFREIDPAELACLLSECIGEQGELQTAGSGVAVVLVTGDLTEQALPEEFEAALRFFQELSVRLGLDKRRFVFLPGNHDVSWIECKRVLLDYEEAGSAPEEARPVLDIRKLAPFDRFVQRFHGATRDELGRALHGGGFVFDFEELGLSIGALNSCEKESHVPADHVGQIGQTQAQELLHYWRAEGAQARVKVLAVHHNLFATVPEAVKAWIEFLRAEAEERRFDESLFRRFAADATGLEGREYVEAVAEDAQAQLLLHGHDHAAGARAIPWKGGISGATHVLSAGSLGLRPDLLPGRQPNASQVIFLDLERSKIRASRILYKPDERPPGRVTLGCFAADSSPRSSYVQALFVPSRRPALPVGPTPSGSPLADLARPATRRSLPAERRALTHEFSINGVGGRVIVGLYEDGSVGEVFLVFEMRSPTIDGLMQCVGLLISTALQHGISWEKIRELLIDFRFAPSGATRNPEIPIAKSVVDYAVRWISSTFDPR